MGKRRRPSKRVNADAVWKALSNHQRRWFCTLIVLIQAVGNERVLERELPAPVLKTLRGLEPFTLYGVIVECVRLLTDVSTLERMKQDHREREGKKKKRTSAAKKRPSASKKKSGVKKESAPKRRTTRASSS